MSNYPVIVEDYVQHISWIWLGVQTGEIFGLVFYFLNSVPPKTTG